VVGWGPCRCLLVLEQRHCAAWLGDTTPILLLGIEGLEEAALYLCTAR
jgi:hypothetical protein